MWCCCLLAKPCPTLSTPMVCSMLGFSVPHHLPEFAQVHVQLNWRCHPTILSSVIPFSSCLQSFPASGSFTISQLFTSGGQNGASASASVLPKSIQGWFPLRLLCNTKILTHVSQGFDCCCVVLICLVMYY